MTVQITELANGLRVVTDTMPDAESIVVGAWVGVGTRHEAWNANGVAHFVEHMMFKGTKTRSAYALSSAIENRGGEMNAHTSREATAYYARALPEDDETAFDVIADMLRHSVFAPKELERERLVVIQEIGRELDSPEDFAFDQMYELALPKQKIGRSILGAADIIMKMPRKALTNYVTRHYTGANMVLVAAGKISHDTFLKMAKARFGNLPKGRRRAEDRAKLSSGIKLLPKDIEQAHLILGFPGPGYHAGQSYYATQLLSLILGGSASSRLFQKVREKRGLVYTINSSHAGFSDTGLFQIYAGTDPKRLRELIPVVCAELRDLRKNVSAKELARAKAQVRADLLMGKESVMRRAEVLGNQMLAFGKHLPPETILRKLMAISQDDVKTAAHRLFSRKPVLTALGPIDELENYGNICARLE